MPNDLHALYLAMEAYRIDPGFGDPRSYLYGTDFRHMRPGFAVF